MTLKENLKSLADNHRKNLAYKKLREKNYVPDAMIKAIKEEMFNKASNGGYQLEFPLLRIINIKYAEDVQKIRTKVRDEILNGVVEYLNAELDGVKVILYRNEKVDYLEFSWR